MEKFEAMGGRDGGVDCTCGKLKCWEKVGICGYWDEDGEGDAQGDRVGEREGGRETERGAGMDKGMDETSDIRLISMLLTLRPSGRHKSTTHTLPVDRPIKMITFQN